MYGYQKETIRRWRREKRENLLKDLSIIGGCCCNYAVFYTKIPDCIGCTLEQECLCCSLILCCDIFRPTDASEEFSCVVCCKKDNVETSHVESGCLCCTVIFPKSLEVCCKSEAHCCCCIHSCSLPPTQDTPCIISAYFLTCYPSCGCCKKFSTVTNKP